MAGSRRLLKSARSLVRVLASADAGGNRNPTLDRLRADPAAAIRAMGWGPDPWQAKFLADPHRRQAMLCCRRAGKTLVSAAKTLAHCLTRPDSLVMVFSPTLRQSMEYARYVRRMDRALGQPLKRVAESMTAVEWANGSRLLSLPDNHEGVVGFTPTRLVVDEGSRVSDVLYLSIRPMLALGAELEVLSTPLGKRGWFFDIFNTPARLRMFRAWRVTADDCPRITPDFLAEERVELGERWFRQEYYLDFVDAVDAVFQRAVIEAARDDGAEPLFGTGV